METAEQRRTLDLTPIFAALEQPLALIDNPERRRDIETYLGSARLHLERAIFDLLSGVVGAVNAAGCAARLQYEGGALTLVIEASATAARPGDTEPAPEAEPGFAFQGDTEKVTIRLPRELKELIDNAADLGGVSANSWYLRELARTVAREMRRGFAREGPAPPWQQRGRRRSSLKGFVGDQ